MISDHIDSHLTVNSPTGNRLEENNDRGRDTRNARIVARAEATGRYHILASTYGEKEEGDYTLKVRSVGDIVAHENINGQELETRALTLGVIALGTFEPGDREDREGRYEDS